MSTDPVNQPVRHADDDLLRRLAAIDQHLHQISTHLATLGSKLLCQLDETHTNLETLIRSLRSARPTVAGSAAWLRRERTMSSGRRLSLLPRPAG